MSIVGGDNEFIEVGIKIVGDSGTEIASFYPHYIHVPFNYISGSSYPRYDYALIYVDDDLSQYGMFKLGYCFDDYINDYGSVCVSGYPQNYPSGYNFSNWGIRFKSYGELLPIDNNVEQYYLDYTADTSGGMSGGPVYVNEEVYLPQYNINQSYKIAIGIHTSGVGTFNRGIRINTKHLKFYYSNPNITGV